MRIRPGIIVMIACIAGSAAMAAPKKIKQVLEAGIRGCDKAPADLNIGPKFSAYVKQACEGKTDCRVGPTQLFLSSDMDRWQCNKGFFVRISCGGSDKQEYPTDNVKEKIEVFCDGP